MSLDVEIRKLDLNTVLKFSDILDKNDSWKMLMVNIPADLGSENSTEMKYSWEEVELIEQAKEQQQRSGTCILFEEWGTSGRVRPTLSTLRKLLVKAELFRAADYVSELLKEVPPERPTRGPPARVAIPTTNELSVVDVKPIPSSVPSCLLPSPALPSPSQQIFPILGQSHDSFEERGLFEDHVKRPSVSSANVQSVEFPSFENEAVSVPYKALVEATNNFNEGNCLGKGACGSVYLGTANPGNRKVAIKRFHEGWVPGGAHKQFHNEIKAISKISHPNLLTLLGFSTDGDSLCLIYTYMPKGSLSEMLVSEDRRCELSWQLRLNISLGIAEGIAHLHSLQPQPLIHRDIKSPNVLLDDNMIPKLCDFGLVRASSGDNSQTTAMTATVIGTSAYMASEAFRGEVSVKTDVFSFGVVLLELLTGLPAGGDDENGPLVDTIYDKRIDHSPTSEFLMNDLVDSTAGDWGGDWETGIANKFLRLALDCIAEKNTRPFITTVIERLSNIISSFS